MSLSGFIEFSKDKLTACTLPWDGPCKYELEDRQYQKLVGKTLSKDHLQQNMGSVVEFVLRKKPTEGIRRVDGVSERGIMYNQRHLG